MRQEESVAPAQRTSELLGLTCRPERSKVQLMVVCHPGNFKGFHPLEIILCLIRAKPLLPTAFSSVRKANIIEPGLLIFEKFVTTQLSPRSHSICA